MKEKHYDTVSILELKLQYEDEVLCFRFKN